MSIKKGTMPPRYDEAFKSGAIKMVTEQGRPSKEVAAELGICIDTLKSWLKRAGFQPGATDRQNQSDKRQRELEAENRALRKQLAEIEKGIDNIVNAIQAGIFSNSTKQRLDELEAEKSELSVQILKEEISKPTITKEEILYYLTKYRKLNMKQLDHRRRLIDSFVNAIYLFDDYLVITFNYKEGTKTITFAEIEEAFGSDLSSLTAPKKSYHFDTTFFIQTAGLAYHHRTKCGAYHQPFGLYIIMR